MMKRMATGLAMALAAWHCGPALAGAAHDALSAMAEPARLAALASAVRGAGMACPAGERSSYMGFDGGSNTDFWTLRCKTGDFLVGANAGPGFPTKVLGCETASKLGVKCWRPF